MKKLITTIGLSLVLAANSFAQMSCCAKPSSTNTFAMLSHDKKFVASHLEPTPFTLANPIGKEISYKTPDGKEGMGMKLKRLRQPIIMSLLFTNGGA